jgi:hypothetical protein
MSRRFFSSDPVPHDQMELLAGRIWEYACMYQGICSAQYPSFDDLLIRREGIMRRLINRIVCSINNLVHCFRYDGYTRFLSSISRVILSGIYKSCPA